MTRSRSETSVPPVRLADGDHGREDAVPRFGLLHRFVGEHAAVPADVLEFLGEVAVTVAHPEAGVMGDFELAVRIVRQAMSARLVVGAGAFDRGVVLGDVQVDGPWTQGGGQACQRLIEARAVPVEAWRDDAILGGVVAERVEEGMGHVGLEAERCRGGR